MGGGITEREKEGERGRQRKGEGEEERREAGMGKGGREKERGREGGRASQPLHAVTITGSQMASSGARPCRLGSTLVDLGFGPPLCTPHLS
jgi:hypothetical protein